MEDEKFLKTSDVARLLGVHRNTIIEWAKNGVLTPAQKTESGYSRYTLQQIAEFCQTAQNLLPSAQKYTKSPTIKNRTAINLQSAAKTQAELKERKSIRLIPAKMLVTPNDKLTKTLFTLPPEEYISVLENGGELVEIEKFPKVGEIITPYWLELIDNYTNKKPLTMFAKAVFTACVSEWFIGNRRTTVGIIFRHITGKPRGSHAQPSPLIRKLILHCIDQMMCTKLKVDMTDVCKYLNYNGGIPLILNAPILPCKYVEEIINGQESDTFIYFLDESPLLTIARVKNNQLLSVKPRLLNISNQSGSSMNISVRHYTIQRVLEIILHKLKPVITFEDVFKKCGFIDANFKKKFQVIREVIEIFKYLVSGNDIKSFIVNKDGNEYVSIEFFFTINIAYL